MEQHQDELTPEELEGIPSAGELIDGKYEVDHIIGIGGMGVVIAGTHLHLQQAVAIKVLLPAFVKNQDIRGRFLREARAAARLRSDHVTRIYDVGALENGLPYMVMERLEGINLADALEHEGPFDVQRAVGYVLQACEAVAEAHAAGIIHRDLKPANLYLASKPNGSVMIKVLDFGISKTVEEGTTTSAGVPALTGPHSLLGSPHYMSPEQVQDSSEVDSRTDIWAMGVLLYELLTKRMPFEAASLPHLYARILSEDPLPPDAHGFDLPKGLTSTILACLAKKRERRIADVSTLAELLAPYGPSWAPLSVEHVRHALEGRQSTPSRPATASPSPMPTPTQMGSQTTVAVETPLAEAARPSTKRRIAALAGVAVASVIAAVIAFKVTPAGSPTRPAETMRAAAVLQGLATAHRISATNVEARIEAARRGRAETAPDVAASTFPPLPATSNKTAEAASSQRSGPTSARPASGKPSTPVRDLKSITLID